MQQPPKPRRQKLGPAESSLGVGLSLGRLVEQLGCRLRSLPSPMNGGEWGWTPRTAGTVTLGQDDVVRTALALGHSVGPRSGLRMQASQASWPQPQFPCLEVGICWVAGSPPHVCPLGPATGPSWTRSGIGHGTRLSWHGWDTAQPRQGALDLEHPLWTGVWKHSQTGVQGLLDWHRVLTLQAIV